MASNKFSMRYNTLLLLLRTCPILFFLLFFFLFLKAEYVGQEVLAWPVDLFFRFDPLILAAHLLTFSPLVAGLWWALLFVALTLILGRFFCGWVCPLGTALDGCRWLLFAPSPDAQVAARWRRAKYYLLIGLLASTPFSLNLVGLFDPLSLLYRSLAIVFYPAFGYGVEKASLTLYRLGPPFIYVSEPLYQFFKATLLPFRPLVYLLPFLTLTLFVLVVILERVERRFWCRALCPLGAFYGLLARFSLLRRRPAGLCPDCGDCAVICKKGAFTSGEPVRHLSYECQLCLHCLNYCPEGRVSFTWRSKAPRAPLDLGRRQVVTALAL
ncbi:MAG: 4Fe-4S binding protein, partial [Acidovorax sp.]|nr:4Fe-4S binding protein [Acidovorax sp.]